MGVSEKSDVSAAEPANREHEYLSGPKLVTVLVAVTLAFFLVMLDTSIVATVRTLSSPDVCPYDKKRIYSDAKNRLYLRSRRIFTPFRMWAGTVARTN